MKAKPNTAATQGPSFPRKSMDEAPSGHDSPTCFVILETDGGAAMRQITSMAIILVLCPLGLAACELVADIFKAGVWVGALVVIGIVALIVWMLSKAGG
jgi:hypothetical protein